MIITNSTIITWEKPNRILENYAILIQDGLIKVIGPEKPLVTNHPGEEILDAGGQIVMPGNICAHTHFYGAFSRGLSIPGSAPSGFPEILQKLWWKLDKALTIEDIQISAFVCLIDAIRHGTTTLIDHHASPNAIEGSLITIMQAVKQSGLRASLCYEVTDRDGPERTSRGIKENIDFLRYCEEDKEKNKTISGLFGLHASLTLSDKTLEKCRGEIPGDKGFHIHVAEHSVDEYDSLEKYGMRVVDRLNKHGILGGNSIIGHGVHLDAKEIQIIAETGTWVTHQPRSNMNNGVGLPEVESMLRAGVKVGIGNDGFSNAMWEEWKTAYLAHKLWHLDPRRMSGADIVEMGVYNNQAMTGRQFGNRVIGRLEVGAEADLILVDYHPFTPMTAENLPWHIIFGFNESMVTGTMVAGKMVMRDRKLLTLDETDIYSRARELAPGIWNRFSS